MTDSDWRPSASLQTLKKRATLLRQIRAFFYAREVLEVETPALSAAGNTDPQIDSFSVNYSGPGMGKKLYLHTSPEFPMKRLLAAGSGAIYQLCKVFRNGEAGRQHNPEFTMLEWYRPEFDHHQLMNEVEELVDEVLGQADTPLRKISYQQAFIEHAGIDPLNVDLQELKGSAQQHGLEQVIGLDDEGNNAWLDLLMDQIVVPALGKGRVFVYDYPASQAALARINPDNPQVAERFELFIDGIEIANGFHELTDACEQRQRFLTDNKKREDTGQPTMPIDNKFIDALEEGMPACAGVALGVDRLLMLNADVSSITEVLAFPIDSA